jgi:hypothetical protein
LKLTHNKTMTNPQIDINDVKKFLDQLHELYPNDTPEVAITKFIADCKAGKYGEEGKANAAKFN